MSYNSTGNGYSLLVCCEGSRHHDWMSFAAWYSLSRNLPDAACAVLATRTATGDYFSWVQAARVAFRYHADQGGDRKAWMSKLALHLGLVKLPLFVVDPDVLAVRELPQEVATWQDCQDPACKVWLLKNSMDKPQKVESRLCSSAQADDFSIFASYEERWGKFVTRACINREDYPFRRVERFQGEEMSLNELRIFELWTRMDRLFTAFARG